MEILSASDLRSYLSKLTRAGAADELSAWHGFSPMKGARGAYSSILVHPDLPYIIKLFNASDVGYKRFLGAVAADPRNPHFPRFRGRPTSIGPETMGIRMEKLGSMSESEFENIEYMLYQMSKDPDYEKNLAPGDLAREFLDKWPGFASAMAALRRAKTGDVLFDWHAGNLMKRSDGTPVIIDPFETVGEDPSFGA